MERRRKDGGYQQAHVAGTTVRNNSLNKLVLLHNAVAEIWSSNRQGSKLFKELVERRRKDCPNCVKYEYQEPAYLICHYLNLAAATRDNGIIIIPKQGCCISSYFFTTYYLLYPPKVILCIILFGINVGTRIRAKTKMLR